MLQNRLEMPATRVLPESANHCWWSVFPRQFASAVHVDGRRAPPADPGPGSPRHNKPPPAARPKTAEMKSRGPSALLNYDFLVEDGRRKMHAVRLEARHA